MSKRGRGADGRWLTGGTGDVKPQIFTLATQDLASDTMDQIQVPLPVPRLGGGNRDKATVFEILSVDWYLYPDAWGDSGVRTFGSLATTGLILDGAPAVNQEFENVIADPRSIAPVARVVVSNAPTSGAFEFTSPITMDMTDGNGNGILVATDSLFLISGNINAILGGKNIAKVKYRLTEVGIQEYVGIVQSQQ